MPVGFENLSGPVQGMLQRGYPDIGQTFYLVDSNYRTAAQGWSKSDHTGPLDIYAEKNKGYVFRTGEYSRDGLAIQAAIDAMVDFRGDTLYFTPGNYSIATAALSINVPDARWVGSPVSDPRLCRATITAAVAAACTTTNAADRMEVAFLRFVPLTAATIWSCVAATDNCHFHHFFYDTNGIAANVGTIFLTHAGATMDHWKFSDFYMLTDAAQGPMISTAGAFRSLTIQNYVHMHEAGVLASALLTTAGVGTGPLLIEGGRGQISGGGSVTNLIVLVDGGIDTTWVQVRDVRNAIGYCGAAALIGLGDAEAAEVNLSRCYLDIVSGGAGGEGTAFTA